MASNLPPRCGKMLIRFSNRLLAWPTSLRIRTRNFLHRATFLKHFNRSDEEEVSRDQWVNHFIASTKLGQTRALRYIKRFGMALASTDPTELFAPDQFNGNTLLGGPIENAWAGAYTVYGAAWKPEIGLDISAGISPPSTWWKN